MAELLKPMTREQYAKALDRADLISDIMSGINWGFVRQVSVQWGDDREQHAHYCIGQPKPIDAQPRTETIVIQIIADPGILPFPRNEDGSPHGEGVIL